jgi:hypothetical protein
MRVVVYRKGELRYSTVERDYPYQVALEHFWVAGENFGVVVAFLTNLSVGPLTGSIVKEGVGQPYWPRIQGQIYNVYCFKLEEDSEKFRKRFGGLRFDPLWQGRGRYRNQWIDPKAGIRGRD